MGIESIDPLARISNETNSPVEMMIALRPKKICVTEALRRRENRKTGIIHDRI
jgi:hypothetical protein